MDNHQEEKGPAMLDFAAIVGTAKPITADYKSGFRAGQTAMRHAATRACEIRAERRFNELGVREPDTNACYYSGSGAEELEARDEEDGDCAGDIAALPIIEEPENQRDQLLALIADDAFAISFQTLAQYRGALLRAAKKGGA